MNDQNQQNQGSSVTPTGTQGMGGNQGTQPTSPSMPPVGNSPMTPPPAEPVVSVEQGSPAPNLGEQPAPMGGDSMPGTGSEQPVPQMPGMPGRDESNTGGGTPPPMAGGQ